MKIEEVVNRGYSCWVRLGGNVYVANPFRSGVKRGIWGKVRLGKEKTGVMKGMGRIDT